MKAMYEYDLVRRMYYHQGLSRREITRRTGIHRSTIEKMILYSSPPGYRMKNPRPKPKLAPFISIIDKILEDDRSAPRKQRHTAKRIFDRLKAEHEYTGGYTIVKDYVREKTLRMKEVFFPLEKRQGTSQTDFGEAKVVIAGKEETAHLFCIGLAYSDAIFAKAYPTEALEALQDGHNEAYEFFNGVPPVNLYDNPRTMVKNILKNGGRDLTDGFLALRSHYIFESHFCNVGRANEKGVVESLVGFVRRNFFVPVPRFPDWESLNAALLEWCRKRLNEKPQGKDKTVGELLEEERWSFSPLPGARFDACRIEERRANSLSLMQFQNNSYSVPVEYAYREVIVKAYVFHVEICHKNAVIAVHRRCYDKDDFIFDPVHYLSLLERKPGALDGAAPFTSWELPECFGAVRRHLEARSGVAGKKEYVQVLQLLRDFGKHEVARAIEKAFECSSVNFESIKMFAVSGREPEFECVRLSAERIAALPKARVESYDVSRYGALLAGGVI